MHTSFLHARTTSVVHSHLTLCFSNMKHEVGKRAVNTTHIKFHAFDLFLFFSISLLLFPPIHSHPIIHVHIYIAIHKYMFMCINRLTCQCSENIPQCILDYDPYIHRYLIILDKVWPLICQYFPSCKFCFFFIFLSYSNGA